MEETKENISNADHHTGFALYRKPGAEMKVMISGGVAPFSGHSVPDGDGFVFVPFQELSRFPKLFVRSDQKRLFSGKAANFLLAELIDRAWLSANVESTSKDAYCVAYGRLRDSMKRGKAEKIVLSKMVGYHHQLSHDWIRVFDLLCANYPKAFVYLFASQASGVWMGATPELLINREGADVQTIALAGTKPVTSEGDWRPKEFVEQNYVTKFIQEALADCGVQNVTVSGPVSINAGQVVHLKTSFDFTFNQLKVGIWDLIDRLHPTPAVSGYPKDEAIGLIVSEEQHDREYYAGYLGPVNSTELSLYVNLRCMKLTQDGAALFVGGGLTLDSDAEEEWNETDLKAQTLMSVLQKIDF